MKKNTYYLLIITILMSFLACMSYDEEDYNFGTKETFTFDDVLYVLNDSLNAQNPTAEFINLGTNENGLKIGKFVLTGFLKENTEDKEKKVILSSTFYFDTIKGWTGEYTKNDNRKPSHFFDPQETYYELTSTGEKILAKDGFFRIKDHGHNLVTLQIDLQYNDDKHAKALISRKFKIE
ncbi:hypothetical protein [uncultured Weeksella sp.]|uniref:hypothetical protein n=1 Tax=uncultured Weeksella sp. TaxID=1161389 RepID=UPI00259B17FE|nr:hypothetical protein [uncultured Weeksella sp.]